MGGSPRPGGDSCEFETFHRLGNLSLGGEQPVFKAGEGKSLEKIHKKNLEVKLTGTLPGLQKKDRV